MNKESQYYRLAFRIFSEFTGMIAIPSILGAIFGKLLDKRYGTYPRYIVICVIIAFATTVLLIIKKTKQYKKEYESLNHKK